MSTKRDIGKKGLSETEVDELVEEEVDDPMAWSAVVKIHPSASSSFSLPAELAAQQSHSRR